MNISEIQMKIKSYNAQPQTAEQAIANIKKMREDLDLTGHAVDKNKLKSIFEKSGSFTDEVLEARKNERA